MRSIFPTRGLPGSSSAVRTCRGRSCFNMLTRRASRMRSARSTSTSICAKSRGRTSRPRTFAPGRRRFWRPRRGERTSARICGSGPADDRRNRQVACCPPRQHSNHLPEMLYPPGGDRRLLTSSERCVAEQWVAGQWAFRVGRARRSRASAEAALLIFLRCAARSTHTNSKR